jgi:hypothetical protein
MTLLTLPHEWIAMGIPGTGSAFFRYLLISAGNSSQKAGDNNAPQDRVEKQGEADATEGEYSPPKLEHTKTITTVYQRLIIAGLNALLSTLALAQGIIVSARLISPSNPSGPTCINGFFLFPPSPNSGLCDVY